MGATKPKHHHSDRDRIYTPESIVKQLIEKIPFEFNDTFCDPCFGRGVFYHNFPIPRPIDNDFYEIDMGRDFLKCNKKWDWCVTNIPFSQPKEFIFKMAECSKKGFGILCLANSMTATRLKKLENLGFFVIYNSVIYVKEWGFGYRTDFYLFGKRNLIEDDISNYDKFFRDGNKHNKKLDVIITSRLIGDGKN